METRANTTLIGLFTLGVIVGAFAFVYWFMRGGEGTNRTEYRVVFSGGVAGLRTGANVFFNGIRIGEVRNIRVDPEDPRQVVAIIAVDTSAPIRKNTRVSLDVQLLSGIAAIAMSGGGANGEEPTPRRPGEPPELRAEASAIQDLLQGARQIMGNVDNLVRRLDDTLATGQGTVDRSLRNVERFTQALGDNADSVGAFLKETGEAARQIGGLTQRLDRVATQIETILQGAEPGRVASILRNIDGLTSSLSEQSAGLGALMTDLRQAAASVERAMSGVGDTARAVDVTALNRAVGNLDRVIGAFDTAGLNRAIANVDRTISGFDTAALNRAIGSVDRAVSGFDTAALNRAVGAVDRVVSAFDSAALNRAIGNVDKVAAAFDAARIDRALGNFDKFAQALGDNSGSVDRLLKDAADVGSKLNAMADRIDGLIRSFSGEGGSGMFAEFTATARSVRVLAERLDQRTATLSSSISGFTDRTIRDIQALSADGRRTLSELERTLRSLERNPQRFIFGGSGVPELNRR